VIPGKQDAAITALAWTYDDTVSRWRLFSFGLDTNIVEWDLRSVTVRAVTSSMGGAIWDAAAQPQASAGSAAIEQDGALVAIATDDGAVRVMIAEPGGEGLQYHKSFGRVDARALSVQWSPDGSVVYGGFSDGCIRANELSTVRFSSFAPDWSAAARRSCCRTEAPAVAASRPILLIGTCSSVRLSVRCFYCAPLLGAWPTAWVRRRTLLCMCTHRHRCNPSAADSISRGAM
jgi:WD40 repeat protein